MKRCQPSLPSMQIKWTKRAAQNLDAVVTYIGQDNPLAAKKFLSELLQKVDHLQSFSVLGRPGVVPLTRELVVHDDYIAYYRIKQERVEILRVLHVRRKYP
jgi:toxin ParE1/3/4